MSRIVFFSSGRRLDFSIQHNPGVDEQPVQDLAETTDPRRVRRGSYQLCVRRAATVVDGFRAQSRQRQKSGPSLGNSQGDQRYITLFSCLSFFLQPTSHSRNNMRSPDRISRTPKEMCPTCLTTDECRLLFVIFAFSSTK